MKQNENIIAVFDDEDVLLNAIKTIKQNNLSIKTVYSPFPIHGVFKELGLKTRFPYIAFVFGALGTLSVFAFIYWAWVIDYPIVVGGKPHLTLSFVIILFEMTIFTAVVLSLIAFFTRQKLYPGKMPDIVHESATDDKFIIVIEKNGNENDIKDLLKNNGALEISERNNIENDN